ncbi:MAG: hypothetical protein ACJAZ1_001658 [Yoonia sp.]|jgi:hypothetical protein
MVRQCISDGHKSRIEVVGVQRNIVSKDSDKSGSALSHFLAKITDADFGAECSILHFGLVL